MVRPGSYQSKNLVMYDISVRKLTCSLLSYLHRNVKQPNDYSVVKEGKNYRKKLLQRDQERKFVPNRRVVIVGNFKQGPRHSLNPLESP